MALTPLQPPLWPQPHGFAHGLAGSGRIVVLSGQVGADEHGHYAEGFTAQTLQALRNIITLVREAGGGPEHVARLTWYVTDLDLYRAALRELGPAWRSVMGRHYPAITILNVTALLEPASLLEIEATAII
ncbi:MAG TPA: RidA family protein, partial [Roseomonas sp.]